MARERLEKSELFELASAPPAPELTTYVAAYAAWRDLTAYAVRRRHLPSGRVALIVNLDATVTLSGPGRREPVRHESFTSGLHEAYTWSESAGRNSGVQVDFTALGARLFYGRPLGELANRSVALEDLLGAAAGRLKARLFEAPTWSERFAVLDREIRTRVLDAPAPKRELCWAWQRLARAEGQISIAELAAEIGWSSRHLAKQFEVEFGMHPKKFARVLRFSRAVAEMSSERATTLADVAADAGYFDQAHLIRDVREFAGVTPRALLGERSAIA